MFCDKCGAYKYSYHKCHPYYFDSYDELETPEEFKESARKVWGKDLDSAIESFAFKDFHEGDYWSELTARVYNPQDGTIKIVEISQTPVPEFTWSEKEIADASLE